MNREGPPLISWDAAPLQAKVDESITRVEEQWLVDLRDAKPYADGHVPGSINIGLRGRLESWVGIMVPWKAPMVLIGSPAEIKEAFFRLHRVAYTGSVLPFEVWTKAGLPLAKSGTIKPGELYAQMQDGSAPIIVDVRMPSEWMALGIGTVVNLPINHLGELAGKLNPNLPVVAVCNSAYRSSLAAGILRLLGIEIAQTGFTTLVTLVLFLGGVQLIAIGLLGEYLARIYDEVKQRPLFIVRKAYGIAQAPTGEKPAERAGIEE